MKRATWGLLFVLAAGAPVQGQGTERGVPGRGPSGLTQEPEGKRLYELGCASCHGLDGRGVARERIAFDTPVPDFSECSFASREPDADWIAVAHEGGPVRGFDPIMPAFGDAFTEEELGQIIAYIRTFCGDVNWPRGELNLPRPLFTEKAYPEDEVVNTVTIATEGPGAVMNEFVYEKRFGARNQLEVKVPFGVVRGVTATGTEGDWSAGVGDVEIGLKRALWHSLEAGSILSVGADVSLPTGADEKGLGTGTVVFEPYAAFGHILPADAFLHAQVVAEFAADRDRAEHELVFRTVLGRTWTQGRFGRSWSPMIEALGTRPLTAGADVELDLVPQMQVTVNTRQHVMVNLGVRVPVTQASQRSTRLLFYVLWDWFDGGFFDGW